MSVLLTPKIVDSFTKISDQRERVGQPSGSSHWLRPFRSVRSLSMAVVAVVGLAAAPSAPAETPDNIFNTIPRTFVRRNAWPVPFVYSDRAAVRNAFGPMVANGWELQNMIADHHFEGDNSQLTDAARIKIRWILTEAPVQHRVIYVRRGQTPQETFARLEAVRTAAAAMGFAGDMLPIRETDMSPPAYPAERIDIVSRKFINSMPDPKLPSSSGGGMGGASAGGGGGGGN